MFGGAYSLGLLISNLFLTEMFRGMFSNSDVAFPLAHVHS